MSIWGQFTQLVKRVFPNRYAQFFFYSGLVVIFVASPSRQKLIYLGIETIPGWYYYAIGAFFILQAIVLAKILPRRQFRSVGAAIKYWVERDGGLDYVAYYNEPARLMDADPVAEPAEEHFHDTQLDQRYNTLSIRSPDRETLRNQWRVYAVRIHRKVVELDSSLAGTVLGLNEKIAFDTVMGGVYYWRLTSREILVGVTIDQRSVDSRVAEDEFTSIGESILELTSRRRS